MRLRRGLSLVELLSASVVMTLIAGALAALAMSVQMANEYSQGHNLATQHGRVALQRIERAVCEATANEQFPGFAVFGSTVGSWDFPDTLVVWHPQSAAVDPEGLPRFDELVIFCPDPASPNRLLEITLPGDARTAYPASDTASWQTELAAAKVNPAAKKTELSDLLRTADAGDSIERGAVRFYSVLRPSETQWSDYQASTVAWEDIDWMQDIRGEQTGLRQAWCRFELQFLPEGIDGKRPPDELALPLFGSAAVYYELHK